mmetsp:Transcript_66500/g.122859  ORF Transcript_66500/g.122859 Transcript_66500/m.122859 type:complete len:383 (-) Transcript_66500:142-1290(-)
MQKTTFLLAFLSCVSCAQRAPISSRHPSTQRQEALGLQSPAAVQHLGKLDRTTQPAINPLRVLAALLLVDTAAAFNVPSALSDKLTRRHQAGNSQASNLRGRACASRRGFLLGEAAVALVLATAGSAPALAAQYGSQAECYGKDPNDMFCDIRQQTYEDLQCKKRGPLGACVEFEPRKRVPKPKPVFDDDEPAPPAPAPVPAPAPALSPEEAELARLKFELEVKQAELEGRPPPTMAATQAPAPAPPPPPRIREPKFVEGMPLISNRDAKLTEPPAYIDRDFLNDLLRRSNDPENIKISNRERKEKIAKVNNNNLPPWTKYIGVMRSEDEQVIDVKLDKLDRLRKRGKVIKSPLGTGMDLFIKGYDINEPEPPEEKLFGVFR